MRYLIIVFIFLISCEKNPSSVTNEYFEALVLGQGIDCNNIYLIQFSERIEEVESITNSNWNIYYADDLPKEFKQDSILIYIKFRNPTTEELYACTTLGPSYPHIRITNAKIKK